MSTDKVPLTEPSPLYPNYSHQSHFNGYQVQPGEMNVNSPDGVPQPREEKDKEDAKKKEQQLDDGDDLLPGTGPSGIPDKYFNVSSKPPLC